MITNYQENANKKYNETSPQASQNGYHEKKWQGLGEAKGP